MGFCGGLIAYSPANSDTGLRFGMRYKYEENGDVLKTLHEVKRKGYVWDPKTQTKHFMKDKAPVVTVGGIEYIWINKEECENKEDRTMELISLKLIAKARPFNKSEWNNNYNEADELREQSEFLALFNCSPEERSKIVPVFISSKDNFMTATPIFEKQETNTSDQNPVFQDLTISASGVWK